MRRIQKVFYISSEKIEKLINECINKEAKERNISSSLVLEEYILSGIARNHPNKSEEIRGIYQNRYGKYIDKFILDK